MPKIKAGEVPPPGLGVTTFITTVLAAATSEALTCACSSLLDTNSVGSGFPPHSTVEGDTKLLPVTVKVKAFTPAVTVLGLSAVIDGAGLGTAEFAE
jgi:hypothetical protein